MVVGVGAWWRQADGTGVKALSPCVPIRQAALGRGQQPQGFCHRCAHSPDTYFSIVFCSSKCTFKISIPSCYFLKASNSCFNKKKNCIVSSCICSQKWSTPKLPLASLPKILLWSLTTLAFSLEHEGGFLCSHCVFLWLIGVHFKSFSMRHTENVIDS